MGADQHPNREVPAEVDPELRLHKRLHIACLIIKKYEQVGVAPPLELMDYVEPHISKRVWEKAAWRARHMLAERCELEA